MKGDIKIYSKESYRYDQALESKFLFSAFVISLFSLYLLIWLIFYNLNVENKENQLTYLRGDSICGANLHVLAGPLPFLTPDWALKAQPLNHMPTVTAGTWRAKSVHYKHPFITPFFSRWWMYELELAYNDVMSIPRTSIKNLMINWS